MTLEDFVKYQSMMANYRPTIESGGLEVFVGQEYLEVELIPAISILCEEEDCNCRGYHPETNWKILDQFPDISYAWEQFLGFSSRQATADKALRRAESGYPD